jgi:hypothetical protein
MKLIMENWRKFIKEAIGSSFDGEMDAMRGIRPGKDMMSDPSYSSGYNSMKSKQNPELARQIYYRLQGLENKPGFEKGTPARKALEALEIRASKSVNAQDGSLNDEEYRQLSALISDSSLRLNPSDPNSFAGKVLAMLSGAPGDTDNDGIPDEKELAIIDRGEI